VNNSWRQGADRIAEAIVSANDKMKKTPRKNVDLWREGEKKDRHPIGRKRVRKGSQEMRGESWMDIRSDRQKGLSYTEPGRKYRMDPRTAKRYAESPERPEYTLSEPKPTKLDAYKQIVDEWLEEAPYSAIRILEKLREMGFDGGYSIVKAYVILIPNKKYKLRRSKV